MQDVAKNFTVVDRVHSSCWLHNTKLVWIVFYDTTHRQPFYEAYKVKSYEKVKQGQMPWAVDNEKLSDGDGFKTLELAMIAAESA